MTTKLTAKQARFVEEYLCDLNATQAAIRAGYSQKTAAVQGSRLLTNVKVAGAIRGGLEERSRRTEITQDWVMAELKENVERAMQHVPVLDRNGNPIGRYTYQGSVANKALELLGRAVHLFSEDDGATTRPPITNIERVEIHLDHGGAGPPAIEAQSRAADALSPGFDAPPAAEEQALS
jgi:hypothetical protein